MAKKNDNRLWLLILSVSLLLNAYYLFYKNKDKTDQVLATAGSQAFRWKDVSEQGQQGFRQMDRSYYLLMKTEAERWAENYVLPKEAEARGMTLDALLQAEILTEVQVSPEETQLRYARSPLADQQPWPQVLQQIEADLKRVRYQDRKREYIKGLFARHGVRFDLVVPKSFDGKEPVTPSRFPVYEPPAPDPLVPSLGSVDAPVVIEVYSDFHCPYCKQFSGTLKELEAQYSGKLRVLFYHFPLSMHPGSELSHQASVCAQEQGKFWEYHDRLMTLNEKPDAAILSRLAAETGLDTSSFQKCYDGGKYKSRVEEDMRRGRMNGVTGAPGYLINGRLLAGAMPIDQLKKIIDWQLKPEGAYPGPVRQQPGAAAPANAPQPSRGLDPATKYQFPADWLKKGPSKGSENAPVTVIEVMDYNCPFCQKGATISEQILAAYPGKVRVVPKNLPLPMHPNAPKTAEAVLCANEQNKFWEFRKELFGDSWTKFTVEDMRAIAVKLQMDMSLFSACLDGSKMKPIIEEDMRVIQSLGGTGTPTFFVNGTPIVGAQPFESFRKVIDEKLAEKK